MRKLNIQQVEFALGMMKQVAKDHPKANVTLNTESGGVDITYPFPDDFIKITSIKMEDRLLKPCDL